MHRDDDVVAPGRMQMLVTMLAELCACFAHTAQTSGDSRHEVVLSQIRNEHGCDTGGRVGMWIDEQGTVVFISSENFLSLWTLRVVARLVIC